jgi:hypothetical protein
MGRHLPVSACRLPACPHGDGRTGNADARPLAASASADPAPGASAERSWLNIHGAPGMPERITGPADRALLQGPGFESPGRLHETPPAHAADGVP